MSVPYSELLSQISGSHSFAREYFGHECCALEDPAKNDGNRVPGKGILVFVAYEIEPSHIVLGHNFLQVD